MPVRLLTIGENPTFTATDTRGTKEEMNFPLYPWRPLW